MPQTKVIDIHCHLTRINPHYKTFSELGLKKGIGLFYRVWAKLIKVKWSNDINTLNQRLDAKLLKLTKEASVDKFVLLALDGAYTDEGELILEKSLVYTSNEEVVQFCKRSPKFIPAFSINPMRKDAYSQLELAHIHGSAFIKWLPGLQNFDPAGHNALNFAKACKKLNMPVLVHIGQEFSFPGMKISKKFHDLDALEPLLLTGCTIIVAHIAGFSIFKEKKAITQLEELAKKYPNLYFDNSGMLVYQRRKRLLLAQKSQLIHQRCLFGSDYPCYVYAMPFVFNISPTKIISIIRTKNLFDKDIKLKKALGFSDQTFYKANEIIYKK